MADEQQAQSGAQADDTRGHAHAALLAWYAANGRAHLPWRHTRDPYAILVSEVMLQQTQVDRVLSKYEEFLARFPTLATLAEAPTADVIKAWASLGYNLRAVRLQQIARQTMAEFGGALPASLEGLLALRGIGRYTAGAVACFAIGLPVATVDTNIRRVLWRVFRGIEPASWPTGQRAARDALALAEWALPPDRAYDWQQALMDLGATVCVSRRPLCECCPLTTACAAYAETARVALFPSGEALARLRAERAASGAVTAGEAGALRVAETTEAYAAGASPARTSRRRAPQPFATSSRYFRGRVVEALRALEHGGTLTLAELGPRVKEPFTEDDLPWLRGIVRGLVRDGLARLVPGAGDEERVALP